MVLTGDLAHFSIVDLVQLLHSVRKTGTLTVTGRSGKVSISFDNGMIIGAQRHSRGKLIGAILIETGVIDEATLKKALQIQQQAGADRKPLISTMLEHGLADRQAAYRCLEMLIEQSIVEVLTWRSGNFGFVADQIEISDDFRYLPERLGIDFILSSEHVLLDALRVFDEKMRDGLLQMEELHQEQTNLDNVEPNLLPDDVVLLDPDQVWHSIPEQAGSEPESVESKNSPDMVLEILKKISTLPEAARILLEAVAVLMPRALTLVVWKTHLVAERGIGINQPGSSGMGPVLGFRIPINQGLLFSSVIGNGGLFYGKSNDADLIQHLHTAIGSPATSDLLLLPVRLDKQVVALIYGDFGNQQTVDLNLNQLEEYADQASRSLMDAVLQRRSIKS